MIIQKIFHTYKKNFPLLCDRQIPKQFEGKKILDIMKNLILEMKELTSSEFSTYITRHTDDQLPEDVLKPFKIKYQNFVNYFGHSSGYYLPTIWFVGFFKTNKQIENIIRYFNNKNIGFYTTGNNIRSYTEINETYWDCEEDAKIFPKYLYQTTMIGLDILFYNRDISILKEVGKLEWMQYSDEQKKKTDIKKLQDYLLKNSPFYKENIYSDMLSFDQYWQNFNKVTITKMENSSLKLGSWPHFLFNICGSKNQP